MTHWDIPLIAIAILWALIGLAALWNKGRLIVGKRKSLDKL